MRRLKAERGFALVMALGLLTVLTISGTAVTYYASTNLTDSASHKARASAYDLAEAGIQDAIATLNNQLDPTTHQLKTTTGNWKKPTDSTLLSTPVTVNYSNLNGSVTYSGTLVVVPNTSYTWVITSTGRVKSGEGYQTKVLKRSVNVMGDTGTGSSWSRFYDNNNNSTTGCLTIDNSTFVTNIATKGDLCLTNGGGVTGAGTTVDVGGKVVITGPDATSPTKPPALGAGWPTTPTNIYTSNGAYAQNAIAAVTTGSNEDATNFGFAVPATAVIEGITATVQRLSSACCSAVQTIATSGTPTGGTFKLNATPYGGSSTVSTTIAYNAASSVVQSALVTIFGSGNVTCTGGPLPAVVTCTFAGADANEPIVLMSQNTNSLTGGSSPKPVFATTVAGSAGALQDATVQLLKAGAPVGSNKAVSTTWGTTLSTITYGSTSDLWGLSSGTLTGADVDASNFGLRFAAKNVAAASATASVDYVTIAIQYKPDAPGIGTSSTPIATANVAGTCTYLLQSAHTPCTSTDHVYAGTITSTSAASNPALVMPTVDYTYWWANAAPGPKHFCTNSNPGLASDFFDNNASTTSAPDQSIKINGEMAPDNADYTCQVVQNGVLKGELSWNHTTHVMTIDGVIFVDGNFRFDYDGHIVHYFGRANIMSSADDEIDSLVCAGGPSTLPDSNDYAKSCLTDMSNWDPTKNMMVLMSEAPNEYDQGGSGCPVNAAWGGTVNGGAPSSTSPPSCYNGHPPGGFQGILYSTSSCLIHQNFQDSGPVICQSMSIPNESGINPTYYTFPYVGAATDGQKYGNPATASAWEIQPSDASGG